jgi:hypothetical protein
MLLSLRMPAGVSGVTWRWQVGCIPNAELQVQEVCECSGSAVGLGDAPPSNILGV